MKTRLSRPFLKTIFIMVTLFFCNVSMSTLSHANVILKELNGKPIDFASLKGKWVFINYWASWCQSCLNEIQELNAFYHHYRDKIELYAVNYDDLPLKDQQTLIEAYHITYPSLQEDPAEALSLGQLVGVPATFVFNPKGRLVNTLYGEQNQKTLAYCLK